MKRYQTRIGLAVGLAVVGMPLTVNAQNSRPSLQLRQTSPLEQADELNQKVIERYQTGRYQAIIPRAEEAPAIRLLAANRHPDVATSLNNLAGLRSANSGSMFPVQASPSSPQLAQVTPNTVTGQLDETSDTLEDGSYFKVHTFEGRAGEFITIELVSDEFDTYLLLQWPDKQTIAQDDDGNGGTNSRIVVTLPTTGTYQVLVNSYTVGATGAYTLSWNPATAADVAQVETLQQAARLNQQVYELYEAGQYQEAIALAEEALSIRREQLGERHLDVARSLNNLALLYQAQGRYGEAEPLLQEALSIRREQFGERYPDVAVSLNNLAELYRDQGRYGEAEPLLQEALSIWREQLGERHLDVATSLNNLASLYQTQGDIRMAVTAFQAGLDIQEWNLELNLATLTEAQRQDYAATLSGTTDGAISLSLQATEAKHLGLITLLRRKGRLLETGTASLQRLRRNLTPADQVVLDDLVSVRQRLATLTFNPPANLPSADYRAQLADLESQATNLEKTLAQRSAVFRADSEPVDMATVQAQIPTDGVLVEYVRYRPFDAQADPANRWGTPRYAAYLLFPNGRIEAIDLGDAAEIDTAVLSLAQALEDPNQSADAIHRRAQTLDALVMAPLRDQRRESNTC